MFVPTHYNHSLKYAFNISDLLQIPPVKSPGPVFSAPAKPENHCLWNSDGNLWNSCLPIELTQNKRQGISEWSDTLSRIRVGEMSEADKRLLDSRRVKNFPGKDFDNATHVFYRNEDVGNHNKKILNKLPGNQATLPAGITGYPPGTDPPLKHGKIADSNFEKTLCLKIGAKVVHNYNVAISDGKY